MLKIGMFSKLTKTTVKTLHHYDEVGLLKPAYSDPINGYRYYDSKQMADLHHIQMLRQLGYSIDEIRGLITKNQLQKGLLFKIKETRQQLQQVQDQLTRLTYLMENLQEEANMNYEAVLKTVPSMIVFYKQDVVKTYAHVQDFILQAGAECGAANPHLECLKPDYCYMSYLDGEYKEKDIRVEYAQAVTAQGMETDTIHFKHIPETTVVSVLHHGAYDTLTKTYGWIMDWLKENPYEIADLPRECYINGIWNKENMEDWLTEIQIPVRHK